MTKKELEKSIYEAFKNVKLEDGIGLREARMIDEHHQENDALYIEAREDDEKEDWKKLLPIFLDPGQKEGKNYVSDTWNFMDSKGKRFHLPCFLLQDLHTITLDGNPLIFTLQKNEWDEAFDELKILNPIQKKAVVNYIDYIIKKNKTVEDGYYSLEDYEKARENFKKYIMNDK